MKISSWVHWHSLFSVPAPPKKAFSRKFVSKRGTSFSLSHRKMRSIIAVVIAAAAIPTTVEGFGPGSMSSRVFLGKGQVANVDPKKPKLILIGGCPGTGNGIAAQQLVGHHSAFYITMLLTDSTFTLLLAISH